jgi:hypothetical protein
MGNSPNLPKVTTHFPVFDALKGYHQIELDEESQNLKAFMMPFGRYIYLRLAFGLSSTSDVFTLKYRNAIGDAMQLSCWLIPESSLKHPQFVKSSM